MQIQLMENWLEADGEPLLNWTEPMLIHYVHNTLWPSKVIDKSVSLANQVQVRSDKWSESEMKQCCES